MYLFVLCVLNERAGVSIPRQANDGTFLPSARDISLAVHKDVDNPHLHLTAMAAIWGQLVHNDISHTPQMAGELFSLLVYIFLVNRHVCCVVILIYTLTPLHSPYPSSFFFFFLPLFSASSRTVYIRSTCVFGQLSLRIL